MQVVLISTNSKILLDQKLEEILNGNQNVVKYNYHESTLTDILEEASYVSMFQDTKYMIVKNADFFGKGKASDKELEMFSNYLENPYQCTILIFTTYDGIDKRKAITKTLSDKHTLIEITAPKNYDLLNETKKDLKKYQVGEQSIKYLIDACLGNYDLIQNEIGKLSLLYKTGDAITLEAMKKIVVENVNDNIFKFTDAVIKKDLQESLHLLDEFYSLKIDALQLINMLVREYKQMYYYKILENKKYSLANMMSELKLQDWQINKIMKNCSNYHKDDLKEAILKLADMDYKIKSGQYDKNSALLNFLIEILEY